MFAAVCLQGDGEIDSAELQRHLEVRNHFLPRLPSERKREFRRLENGMRACIGVLTVWLPCAQVLASEKQARKLGRSPSRDYESKRAAGINPEADSP